MTEELEYKLLTMVEEAVSSLSKQAQYDAIHGLYSLLEGSMDTLIDEGALDNE